MPVLHCSAAAAEGRRRHSCTLLLVVPVQLPATGLVEDAAV